MKRLSHACRLLALGAALCLVPVLNACGANPSTAQVVQPEKPKAKDAHLVALKIVDGKVGTMLHMDRIRDRPAAQRVVSSGLVGDYLDGTGIDPLRDVQRVFVASTGIRQSDRAVVVVWHRLGEAQAKAMLGALVQRDGSGAWLPDVGVPAARVVIKGHTRVIALVAPEYLVVLPVDNAKDAAKFAGTGGLPDPEGSESGLTIAQEPSKSLHAPHLPDIPESIKSARILLNLGTDGSVDFAVDGESLNEEQAKADAQTMGKEVENATSIKVAIVRVRLFKPVDFRAEGAHVKTEVHLSAQEVDKLMGMAQVFLRQAN
jgi:hypothetical protein